MEKAATLNNVACRKEDSKPQDKSEGDTETSAGHTTH